MWREGSTYLRNSVWPGKEMEFLNRSNANKQRTWWVGVICGNLNYLRCIIYYRHELSDVCVNSAVSKSFSFKTKFVDHGRGSGLIMLWGRRKANSSLNLIKCYNNHYLLSFKSVLSNMVATRHPGSLSTGNVVLVPQRNWILNFT